MMAEDTLTEIKVSLAEIKMATSNTDRRMSNLEAKIDSYPTRRDFEALEKRMSDADVANAHQIASLADFQKWIQRAVFGLFITGVGALLFIKPAKSLTLMAGTVL